MSPASIGTSRGSIPLDPLVEIRDPVRLAHLAVVDDVDSRLDLAPDDVRDGVLERLLVALLGPAAAASSIDAAEVEELGGTDEAPGVSGEDPLHQGFSAVVDEHARASRRRAPAVSVSAARFR